MVPYLRSWWQNFHSTYVGNAQAVRDFRSQLRGTRPLVFWGGYLGVLILTATVAYGNLVREGQDFAGGQAALHLVYQILMALLGIVICVAAPALTATAITQERQKRSLDLVACSPITTRYYLVGKMLSSFRYIWMLLILSLPVTSMCVVLGGATWGDVLSGYVMLSASGLVMTSLCLLFSSLLKSGISALNASYLFIAGVYLPATYALSFTAIYSPTLEAPWYTGLFPLLVPLTASTYSTLFGMAIPNYLFICAFSLFAVRYVLLGAASVMGHYGSHDIRKFRQNTLLVLGLLSYGGVVILHDLYAAMVAGNPTNPSIFQPMLAQASAPIGLFLMFLTCYISVFSRAADERFRDDGMWNLKRVWLGTPSGALPFMALVVLSTFGVAGAYGFTHFGLAPLAYLMGTSAWTIGGILTAWLLARTASLRNMTVTQARVTSGLVLSAAFAIPSMILAIASSIWPATFPTDLWELSFVSLFAGKITAVSLGTQFLLMAMMSTYCIKKLRSQGSSPVNRKAVVLSGTGIPLPQVEESLLSPPGFTNSVGDELAADELQQRPIR